MTTPVATRPVSPLDAVSEAVEHTKRLLFPFRFERWLTLGFLAFLDQCGRGAGVGAPKLNYTTPYPFGGGNAPSGGPSVPEIVAWIGAHVGLLVGAAILLLTFMVLLSALILWVNSRGIFMYMDVVATGRQDVGRPWHEHAERAQSLFAWRFGLAMAALVAMLLLVGMGGLGFLAYSRGRVDGMTLALIGGLLLLPSFLALMLASGLFGVLLRDIVAPLQWRFEISCGEAIRRALALVRANPGAFALYVLMKLAVGMVLVFVVTLAGCLTCCLGFLPVVSQTLLQPLFFFERAWSLCFVRQMGCDVFPAPASVAPPSMP